METVREPRRAAALNGGGDGVSGRLATTLSPSEHLDAARGTGHLGNALVLGFDAEYAAVVCEVLSGHFNLRMTTAPDIALGLLARVKYDAVVVEAGGTGQLPLQALLRHVRSCQPDAGLVVTSQQPMLAREVVECFEADADECIVAPFHPNEFLARVTRMVRRSYRHAMQPAATSTHEDREPTDTADRIERSERVELPRTVPTRPAADARVLVGAPSYR